MKRLEVVLLVFVLILFGFLLYLAYTITTEGSMCMFNPESYIIDKMEKASQSNISCYCLAEDQLQTYYIFGSNTTGSK